MKETSPGSCRDTSQVSARTAYLRAVACGKGGHSLQWGQNSDFRVSQTQFGILVSLVTSCVTLVSLVASLSLRLFLRKMDTITLLPQDLGWLK